QRQRTLGITHPAFQFAPRRAEMQPAEALVERGIEGVIAREPLLVAGVLPEADDVVGFVHGQALTLITSARALSATAILCRGFRY
ncbi:hypothetical protein Llan_2606, partial [Legionella lansingensis]